MRFAFSAQQKEESIDPWKRQLSRLGSEAKVGMIPSNSKVALKAILCSTTALVDLVYVRRSFS